LEFIQILGKERDNAVAVYARVSSRDQKKDLEQKLPESYDKVYEIKDI